MTNKVHHNNASNLMGLLARFERKFGFPYAGYLRSKRDKVVYMPRVIGLSFECHPNTGFAVKICLIWVYVLVGWTTPTACREWQKTMKRRYGLGTTL